MTESASFSPTTQKKSSWWKLLVRGILPILIIAVGLVMAIDLVKTQPQAHRKPSKQRIPLVETRPVKLSRHKTFIQAMGTVVSARKISLYPQVSGKIVKVSKELIPGGRFRTGQQILEIEAIDYQWVVQQKNNAVARAKADLQIEMGQQALSKREYKMLGQKLSKKDEILVLRKPQLASAKADLQDAETDLAQAKLDLKRTQILAPFNGMVVEQHVDIGSQVNNTTALLSLVSTDKFWLKITVPMNQLKWISIPKNSKKGSKVRIYNDAVWGKKVYRTGRVIRLLPELDTEGQMAQLLVEVIDPLALTKRRRNLPKILLNDYLRVEIKGPSFNKVIALERELLHNGNVVRVLNNKQQLEMRPVNIVFRTPDKLFINKGLKNGEHLIVTEISTPVTGMLLRTSAKSQHKER